MNLTKYAQHAINLLQVAKDEPTNIPALKQVRVETKFLRNVVLTGKATQLIKDLLFMFEQQVLFQNNLNKASKLGVFNRAIHYIANKIGAVA